MKKLGPYHYRQWLRQKYIDEELSGREIAAICNVDHKTIYYYLKKYGIDTRKRVGLGWGRIHFHFPDDFLDSLRSFSQETGRSMSSIVRSVLTEYMIANKFNPFSGRKFRDKNV